jgi:hypothetical protein
MHEFAENERSISMKDTLTGHATVERNEECKES